MCSSRVFIVNLEYVFTHCITFFGVLVLIHYNKKQLTSKNLLLLYNFACHNYFLTLGLFKPTIQVFRELVTKQLV